MQRAHQKLVTAQQQRHARKQQEERWVFGMAWHIPRDAHRHAGCCISHTTTETNAWQLCQRNQLMWCSSF